jgi:hypothetical protein
MDMYRLLKISSITGSTVVPTAVRVLRGVLRSRTRWFRVVIVACHSGSTTVVAFASAMIAGPSTRLPGPSSSRR